MKFKTQYVENPRYQTINNEPSMVKPEFEDELEINNIMDRYVKTGYMPVRDIEPKFADFSLPSDFGTMQDKILAARAAFIDLPVEVRDQYRTAEALINALSDPHEESRLIALGIREKRQEAPQEAPVTSESASVPKNKKAPVEPPAS